MKTIGLLLLGAFVAASVWCSDASAFPQIKKAFATKYLKGSTPAFQAAVKKANCFVCHAPGDDRSQRNDYGKALAKITGGSVKADMHAAKTSAEKKAILEAAIKKLTDGGFDDAAKEKAPDGKTFGENIQDGKLPNS